MQELTFDTLYENCVLSAQVLSWYGVQSTLVATCVTELFMGHDLHDITSQDRINTTTGFGLSCVVSLSFSLPDTL